MTPVTSAEVATDAYVATLPNGTITEEWALELVMLRLRRRAWGGIPFTIEDQSACATALAAIERLVELREEYLVSLATFRAWEVAEAARYRTDTLLDRVRKLPLTFPALAVWSTNTCTTSPRSSGPRQVQLARAAAWEVQSLVAEASGDLVTAASARAQAERALPPHTGAANDEV